MHHQRQPEFDVGSAVAEIACFGFVEVAKQWCLVSEMDSSCVHLVYGAGLPAVAEQRDRQHSFVESSSDAAGYWGNELDSLAAADSIVFASLAESNLAGHAWYQLEILGEGEASCSHDQQENPSY